MLKPGTCHTDCVTLLCRRGDAETLLSLTPAVQAVLPPAVQHILLVMMQQVEALRGRRLYPVLIDELPQDVCEQPGEMEVSVVL